MIEDIRNPLLNQNAPVPVILANIERQINQNRANDEQIIKAVDVNSSILSLDTKYGASDPSSHACYIRTNASMNNYKRLKLMSADLLYNISNINIRNNGLTIIFYNAGLPSITFEIDVTLVIGYYDLDDTSKFSIQEIQDAINARVVALGFESGGANDKGFVEHNVGQGDYFLLSRVSLKKHEIGYHQIEIDPPNSVSYDTFEISPNCSFYKYGSFVIDLHLEPFIFGTPLITGICYMVYTRYLSLRCPELTRVHPLSSFENNKVANDLIFNIPWTKENQAGTNSDYMGYSFNSNTIYVRNNRLEQATLYLVDEWGFPWEMGNRINGRLAQNQLHMTFMAEE